MKSSSNRRTITSRSAGSAMSRSNALCKAYVSRIPDLKRDFGSSTSPCLKIAVLAVTNGRTHTPGNSDDVRPPAHSLRPAFGSAPGMPRKNAVFSAI